MSYKKQVDQLVEKLGIDKNVVEEVSAIVESAIASGITQREAEITEQVESAAREAAQLVHEHKIAIEAQVTAEAEAVAREFVVQNRERFVQTEAYDNMVSLVNSLKEAFSTAGIGTDNLELVSELRSENAKLKAQLDEAYSSVETYEATIMLTQMLQEHNLSLYQRERVMNLLQHTRPDTLSEFKTIAENIISEVKADDKTGDDEDEDDAEDNRKQNMSERMQQYLNHAK